MKKIFLILFFTSSVFAQFTTRVPAKFKAGDGIVANLLVPNSAGMAMIGNRLSLYDSTFSNSIYTNKLFGDLQLQTYLQPQSETAIEFYQLLPVSWSNSQVGSSLNPVYYGYFDNINVSNFNISSQGNIIYLDTADEIVSSIEAASDGDVFVIMPSPTAYQIGQQIDITAEDITIMGFGRRTILEFTRTDATHLFSAAAGSGLRGIQIKYLTMRADSGATGLIYMNRPLDSVIEGNLFEQWGTGNAIRLRGNGGDGDNLMVRMNFFRAHTDTVGGHTENYPNVSLKTWQSGTAIDWDNVHDSSIEMNNFEEIHVMDETVENAYIKVNRGFELNINNNHFEDISPTDSAAIVITNSADVMVSQNNFEFCKVAVRVINNGLQSFGFPAGYAYTTTLITDNIMRSCNYYVDIDSSYWVTFSDAGNGWPGNRGKVRVRNNSRHIQLNNLQRTNLEFDATSGDIHVANSSLQPWSTTYYSLGAPDSVSFTNVSFTDDDVQFHKMQPGTAPSPAYKGMFYYDAAVDSMKYYNGTKWVNY